MKPAYRGDPRDDYFCPCGEMADWYDETTEQHWCDRCAKSKESAA